ncbi:COG1306 predicted glycoside hydrolase [hydrothermal vent metagenome]|uniref:COG1306 predicted glycoside hydrolase n=1 Tax=hydrothermal vent metagenome TaxID=652676 RepID=A0A1W1CSQ3_9ZZZZ
MFAKKLLLFIAIFPSLLLASFRGYLIDAKSNLPIANATISDTNSSTKSDKNGLFYIDSNSSLYHIKAYGYRPLSFYPHNNKTIKLEPIKVKALYLTFWGASNNSSRLKKILNIIDTTEVNALVVDVKNEYGSTMFLTNFKEANSYGAQRKRTNRNIQKFIQTMRKHHIYTIARIVTFKDEIQASHNPEYAIKKKSTHKIWRNSDNMAWVDPFDKRSRNYTLAIAQEAAKVGFDEINFDYIRFPAKRGLHYLQQCTQAKRIEAIEKFLDEAKTRLQQYGVFISVDTYGNICWSKDDNGIGQTVTSLAKYADYLCPMLYPSGFSSGSFHFKYPSLHPYQVVYRSVKHIQDRISSARVRPWLQGFRDYTSPHKEYKKIEIQAQIQATEDIGTNGWMLWSPSSRYKKDYLLK